ncbi:hypothetical protein SDC9_132098 [bioreactor metagenome]|uniref:Uncharacterized protein n=1 Tax=bioreactor metagenome TaxID=1076179 RepID=A0A645D6Z2_9ZZZZ
MILTTFIMQLDRSSRNLPTRQSGPPFIFTPKPKMIENTINGSMARRLNRPTKSSAVRKLTISSATLFCSSTVPAAISCQGTSTGGISFISTIMMTAAMAPVITKAAMVVPIILPARLALFMLATAPEMDANTMGTTMQNIRLIKI